MQYMCTIIFYKCKVVKQTMVSIPQSLASQNSLFTGAANTVNQKIGPYVDTSQMFPEILKWILFDSEAFLLLGKSGSNFLFIQKFRPEFPK